MQFIKTIVGTYFNLLAQISPKSAGKQSFYFFCIPFKAKLKPNQQEFLDTATNASLKLDTGKTIQTYEWGKGAKLILFVHGWQSHSYRWKAYIDRLNKSEYKVIAFDAPGHGNSEGFISNVPMFDKAISAVVGQYGLPYAIVAHSIGAFSSMYYMSRRDVKIKKFVSMASPHSVSEFVSVYRSELKLSEKLTKHLKAYFQVYTSHPAEYFSIENFSKDIKAESLLIHDKQDSSTSFTNTEKLHEVIENSTLHLTDGLGHRLRSVELIEKVCEFIE